LFLFFYYIHLAPPARYHQLAVVVPDRPDPANAKTGWIWITGGHNTLERAFSPLAPPAQDAELAQAVGLAVSTGTVTAVLHQVPNQPVFFADELPYPAGDDPSHGRTEDAIISYGWHRFLFDEQDNADWLLRLPMTKAVARAMDTVIDWARREAGVAVEQFVVGGASKRGWTTWTTGIAEPRTAAIVPVVMDLLNMPVGVEAHFKSLGGWTLEFADYVAVGCVGPVVRSPQFLKMCRVNDPYFYLPGTGAPGREPFNAPHFVAMPKLVINGGNDEFFLPDDNHHWWDQMPGEKHLLHVPNADHPLRFWPPGSGVGAAVANASISAFYGAVVRGEPRPSFRWEIAENGSSIVVSDFSVAPLAVSAVAATTQDGYRDFRLVTCRTGFHGNCTQPEAQPGGGLGAPVPHPIHYVAQPARSLPGGRWVGEVPTPPFGYTAFFVDVLFAGGQHYTTQMSIVPKPYPYEWCEEYGGDACSRLV
jgi:PhoPQ-activated pathogenicity-related protein